MSRELKLILFIVGYWIFVSIIAVIITILDKYFAVHKKRRIPEETLMLISAFGGSVAMFITMKVIHHKTRKPKFMYGLPIIFFIHIVILMVAFYVLKIL